MTKKCKHTLIVLVTITGHPLPLHHRHRSRLNRILSLPLLADALLSHCSIADTTEAGALIVAPAARLVLPNAPLTTGETVRVPVPVPALVTATARESERESERENVKESVTVNETVVVN